MQTLLPHCSLATVNSITWSNLKCWLVLERLSGLGSSLIICFLTHKQPCPLCSPVQLTIAISGWWALCCQCVQLPRAANFLFFYRNLLPTTLPLLQRAPQQCHREKERHKEKRCPNQSHTHRDQKKAAQESCILTSTIWRPETGNLPYWDPYPGPSTLSPVFLVCEKHPLLYPPEPIFNFLFKCRLCCT